MSATGENEQGLRKIIDLTRFASIFILLLHYYYFCYRAFEHWGLQWEITDRLLKNISDTGLFGSPSMSKLLAIGLLVVSLLGAQGKKDEKIGVKTIATYLLI